MEKFVTRGVEIAYKVMGNPDHRPILLIHGFGSTYINNWVEPGWADFLVENGFFVVMMDNRGHGQSQKLYEQSDYDIHKLADDAHFLMQHLGIKKYDVLGYSMGARISAFLGLQNPSSVNKIIFGGLGMNIVHGTPGVEIIADALLANDLADVSEPLGRMFRIFADHTGSDRKALAACILAPRRVMTLEEIEEISQEVLVAIGSVDDVSGSGAELVDVMQNATFLDIPKRDHMRATGDKVFKAGALEFLND